MQATFRSLEVDGHEIEFSGGFADLPTASYQEVLKRNGFGIDDARESIEAAHLIRHAKVSKAGDDAHPLPKGGG
jgi:UDP-N-acetyl-2-amino-2-deoxyglucuronate dehydrogenase